MVNIPVSTIMAMNYKKQIDEYVEHSVDFDDCDQTESNPKSSDDDIDKIETSYWEMIKAWFSRWCCNCRFRMSNNDKLNIFEAFIISIMAIVCILYMAYIGTAMLPLMWMYCGDVSRYPIKGDKTQIIQVNNTEYYVYVDICDIDNDSDGYEEDYCYEQLCLVTNNSTKIYGVYKTKTNCPTLIGMQVEDTITVYYNDAMVEDGVVSICPLDEKSHSYYSERCKYVSVFPIMCVFSFEFLLLIIFAITRMVYSSGPK